MMTILSLFASPVVRVLLLALGGFSLLGAAEIHGRVHEHGIMVKHEQAVLAEQMKEANDAIAAANAARDAAQKKFDDGKFRNRPGILPGRVRHGSDGFSRD